MAIIIIDMQKGRRDKLEAVARAVSRDVMPVESSHGLVEGDQAIDCVLLHVGDNQALMGDDIASLLGRFQDRSWVLCYYGGAAARAAKASTSPNVAVFRSRVHPDVPEDEFLRTVEEVLGSLQQRETLPQHWFRSVVTGVDAMLEAKLAVLAAVLTGAQPQPDHLDILRKSYHKAFGDTGELISDLRHPARSADRLRMMFFHEEPTDFV